MKLAALAFAALACSAATAPTGFPFADEVLNYSIVWPSGVSLGEAHLQAAHVDSGWNFDLRVDASLPGYAIVDHYRSTASASLCSSFFERTTAHGTKKTSERTTVSGGTATRQTTGGGKSELAVSACAQDALTLLFLVRRDLGQGKISPGQVVVFGPGYPITFEYGGQRPVPVNGVPTDSDKVIGTIRLPKGLDFKIEMYFARDAARTPLVMRAPFAIGTFSVELQR